MFEINYTFPINYTFLSYILSYIFSRAILLPDTRILHAYNFIIQLELIRY